MTGNEYLAHLVAVLRLPIRPDTQYMSKDTSNSWEARLGVALAEKDADAVFPLLTPVFVNVIRDVREICYR
jgi:hypothetical protein